MSFNETSVSFSGPNELQQSFSEVSVRRVSFSEGPSADGEVLSLVRPTDPGNQNRSVEGHTPGYEHHLEGQASTRWYDSVQQQYHSSETARLQPEVGHGHTARRLR
jgi:hypothetical protein